MKNIFCALAFLFFVAPGFSQTIYIANSNTGATGGTNVFTGPNSINLALAAAANGDIIYVVPSSITYSNPNLNGKGVSLIGGGFNPDKPGGAMSTIADITANANNFRLSGLVITGGILFSGGSFSNIMIDKCRFRYLDEATAFAKGNVTIQNCIIGENGAGAYAIDVGSGSSNVRISNNIIYCTVGSGIGNLNAATIENNIFIGLSSGSAIYAFGGGNGLTLCGIRNNIFYGVRPTGSGTYSDNTQENNISFGSSDDTFSTSNSNSSTGNLQGQDPQFVNLTYGAIHSFTYDLTLQPGSPALGTGIGGTDMGIFGGLNPFDIYGTSLPIVRTISAPNTVSQGSNLNVRVEAKGN